MFRIGKFNDDPEARPRPLKIVLKSQDDAIGVVKNAKKLKVAPQDADLQNLSISHDLTKSEREIIKKMVAQAKEKSQNSPNWDFKVVGPPWKPVMTSFRNAMRSKQSMHL